MKVTITRSAIENALGADFLEFGMWQSAEQMRAEVSYFPDSLEVEAIPLCICQGCGVGMKCLKSSPKVEIQTWYCALCAKERVGDRCEQCDIGRFTADAVPSAPKPPKLWLKRLGASHEHAWTTGVEREDVLQIKDVLNILIRDYNSRNGYTS